jgi:hypothetical protein
MMLLDLIDEVDVLIRGEQDRDIDVRIGEVEDEVPAIVEHSQFLVDELELIDHHQELIQLLSLNNQLHLHLLLLDQHLYHCDLLPDVVHDSLVEQLNVEVDHLHQTYHAANRFLEVVPSQRLDVRPNVSYLSHQIHERPCLCLVYYSSPLPVVDQLTAGNQFLLKANQWNHYLLQHDRRKVYLHHFAAPV